MQCTVEEIAEKRRIAQEKLKARQNRAITNENTSLSTASTTRTGKLRTIKNVVFSFDCNVHLSMKPKQCQLKQVEA